MQLKSSCVSSLIQAYLQKTEVYNHTKDLKAAIQASNQAIAIAKKTTILQQAKPAGAYQEAEPAKFVGKPDTYYLQEKGKTALYVAGKKELPGLFPDKNKEVTAFIKKHKVKINKPESLRKLVLYYNGLVAN